MNSTRTTNILLILLLVPLVFYLINILSFVIIPLLFSLFIALVFMPLVRNLTKRGSPNWLSVGVVLIILSVFVWGGVQLIKLGSQEIIASKDTYLELAKVKFNAIYADIQTYLGLEKEAQSTGVVQKIIESEGFLKNFGSTLGFVGDFVSKVLITLFFVILWLAGSIDFPRILSSLAPKRKQSLLKNYLKIESDLVTFIKVKVFVSALTGIGFTIACYAFDVSFPIFWGLFAFAINFIQMIGSVISVVLITIFALVELDISTTLLLFALTTTAVQVICGGILEPILMGKSFSINIIAVLVMLMFWGFLLGIPGLIMAIPITVLIKTILEQFSGTKILAQLIAGEEKQKLIIRRK